MENTISIAEFAKKSSWKNCMDASKGLDSWDNYSGTNLGHKIIVISQTRDSEILDQSNFDTALEMLGGESKDVEVIRFGHWACGWIESVMVNPKAKRKVKIALEIHNSLQNYPVLDESDFSEREDEYQSEYAEQAKEDLSRALELHFRIKNGKVLKSIAFDLNMECQGYYGNSSCVDVYTCRKPDKRDIERLLNCIGQMEWRHAKSKVFKKLVAAIKAYKVIL
jgi:hypothetical protein